MDAISPGDREAAAAIAATQEFYGHVIAVGDWITFRRASWPAGKTASGRVSQSDESSWLVNVNGEPCSVIRSELVLF
jgi:hypothetical protein